MYVLYIININIFNIIISSQDIIIKYLYLLYKEHIYFKFIYKFKVYLKYN